MEQLTADGGSPQETLEDTDGELDRTLARAIRQLISGQNALIGDPAARDLLPVT
jgi:hypothetical protein